MVNLKKFIFIFCMLLSFRLSAIIEITYVKNCSSTSASDGQMEAVANGNAGPFNFQWSNGVQTNNATSSKITNLTPGTYSVTVSTQNGCTFVLSASVGICGYGYPGFEIQTVTVVNATLPNENNGIIDINIINNTAYKSYTYKWTDANGVVVATTQDLINIPAGTYTILVTNGCYEQRNTYTIKDCHSPSPPIRLEYTAHTDRCSRPGSNYNRIDLKAITDFPPVTYSWTGPNGFSSTNQNLNSIQVGKYNITVTDKCGRTKSDQIYLKCCDEKTLPYTRSTYNCFTRDRLIGPFLIPFDQDGEIEVVLRSPVDNDCGKKYTFNWSDGSTNDVVWNESTNKWDGVKDKNVPVSSNSVQYCVTITNQCGCSAVRCEYFGKGESDYSGFGTVGISNFFNNNSDYALGNGDEFSYYDQYGYAITSCYKCKGCGMDGATNVLAYDGNCGDNYDPEDSDLLTYSDPAPTDEYPCQGGTISCINNPSMGNHPWTIQDQFRGTEVVDYKKVETRIINGVTYCVNPAWCLFPPGTIDNFPSLNIPVLVKNPNGKIILGAEPPCNPGDLVTPPYTADCPGGMIGPDPNGFTEDCILPYICLSTGHIVNQIQEEVIFCRCNTGTDCYMAYKCEMFQGNTGQFCNAFSIDYDSNCEDYDVDACIKDYARPAGRTESSGSRSNNKDPFSIQVYPNPNSGQVQISINPGTLLKDNHVSISLSDVAGRNLMKKEVQVFSDNPVYTLSMVENNIAPGAYYLTIKVANRPNMSFLILVVQ